jgi:hypothetical protein
VELFIRPLHVTSIRNVFALCCAAGLVTAFAASVPAQTKAPRVDRESDPFPYVTRDRSTHLRFRVGLRIEAGGGIVQKITATSPCPLEWPEQEITLVAEDAPFGAQIDTRKLSPTGQQMLIRIPGLTPGSAAVCTRTYELIRWTQRTTFDAKTKLVAVPPDRARNLLLPSDGIESTHAEIRKFASDAIGDKTKPWDRVNALFAATRQRIKYTVGPFAGALAGLRSGQGDCEELACLFIASCRASGIPARIVWGPEHTWAEFALADPDDRLVWIPADPSKERELGVINHYTPIFQKGDRFLVPEKPGKPQRYLLPMCTGVGSTPRLESIETIELLNAPVSSR